MAATQRIDSSWEVCRGVLYLQRKTRLIANELGAAGLAGIGISISEGLLLHILESETDKTVKDLAEILKLERSWVSRLVSSLEERKLAASEESSYDKRAKIVSITSKGEEQLVKLNEFRHQVMQRAVSDLSSAEQNEFGKLIHKLADSLKALRFVVTKGSHEIDAGLARLSWAIGVMGENFFGSGMGVAQFHIFEVIATSDTGTLLASDINDLLPFDMSTITRTIVNFEKAGFVSRKSAASDKRSVSISLNRKGEDYWKQIRGRACEYFASMEDHLSSREIARIIELFQAATVNLPLARLGSLKNNIEIKEINSPELIKQARDFSESSIFSQKLLRADNDRSSYLLYAGDNVCGIASIEHKTKKSKEDKFTITLSGLSDSECNALMKQLNRWRKRQAQ